MARTAAIGVRVAPEIKAAAEKAARDDHRTLASLLEKLLVGYLREHGYLGREAAGLSDKPIARWVQGGYVLTG
jgi:hypothetical protein